MKKFALWVAMSFLLAIVSVVIVSIGDNDAGAFVKKKKGTYCPDGFIERDINFPEQRDADLNNNDRVCENPAGKIVDDIVPVSRKKKVPPKK